MASRKVASAFQLAPEEDEALPAAGPAIAAAPAPAKAAREVPEHRKGRKNLSVWIDEKAFRQFKAMVAEDGVTLQDYMIRLLNHEFARKGRPEIAK